MLILLPSSTSANLYAYRRCDIRAVKPKLDADYPNTKACVEFDGGSFFMTSLSVEQVTHLVNQRLVP